MRHLSYHFQDTGGNKIHSFLLKHLFTNENKHPHNITFKISGKSVELLSPRDLSFSLGKEGLASCYVCRQFLHKFLH